MLNSRLQLRICLQIESGAHLIAAFAACQCPCHHARLRGGLGADQATFLPLAGVGRIAPRAVVEQGVVVARDRVTLSLAADHRVSDGRRGAQFLARIGALLQQPERL